MSAAAMNYELNRVLFAIAAEHKMVERLSDEDLGPYRLSGDEVAALKTGDTDALYRLGANPYLIRRVFRGRFRV